MWLRKVQDAAINLVNTTYSKFTLFRFYIVCFYKFNLTYMFMPLLYSLTFRVAVNPPDLAREDWTIIRALSEVIYIMILV